MSKVTIAVPVYGVEKYIERCARSLFGQTCQEIEYLFVDDCTQDRSIDILMKTLEDYPKRKSHVRVIRHEKNGGLGAARNTAVDNCQTEFIMHVDSDDSIELNTIERVLAKQVEDDYDIVSFGFQKITPYGQKQVWKKPEVASARHLASLILARKIPVCVCGALYRTSLYKDNGIRVADGVNQSEDYCVTPRLAYFAKKVATLPDLLYIYYFGNEDAYTTTYSEAKSQQVLKALAVNVAFFKEKGGFDEELRLATDKIILGITRNTLREPGHSQFYYEMKKRSHEVSKEYLNSLNLFYRMLFSIDNYAIAFTLYQSFRWAYRRIARLKSMIAKR